MNVSDLMNSKASEGKVERRHKKAAVLPLSGCPFMSLYDICDLSDAAAEEYKGTTSLKKLPLMHQSIRPAPSPPAPG